MRSLKQQENWLTRSKVLYLVSWFSKYNKGTDLFSKFNRALTFDFFRFFFLQGTDFCRFCFPSDQRAFDDFERDEVARVRPIGSRRARGWRHHFGDWGECHRGACVDEVDHRWCSAPRADSRASLLLHQGTNAAPFQTAHHLMHKEPRCLGQSVEILFFFTTPFQTAFTTIFQTANLLMRTRSRVS